MSWKPVEMQVALPRTYDASKIQDQMQQQSKYAQELLASNQIKTEEHNRKRVNDANQKDNVKNKNQERNESGSLSKGKILETKDFNVEEINHPYLGKKIDFNG